MEIQETEQFSGWLAALRDARAKQKIAVRVQRLKYGNPGDVKPIGKGISEMWINYGPGYRVYYIQRGGTLIVLLCGGDKKTQDNDIEQAKSLLAQLPEE